MKLMTTPTVCTRLLQWLHVHLLQQLCAHLLPRLCAHLLPPVSTPVAPHTLPIVRDLGTITLLSWDRGQSHLIPVHQAPMTPVPPSPAGTIDRTQNPLTVITAACNDAAPDPWMLSS